MKIIKLKRSYYILVFLLSFFIVLLTAFLIKNSFYHSNAAEQELSICALGEKSSVSAGTDVRIVQILVNNTAVPLESIEIPKPWLYAEGIFLYLNGSEYSEISFPVKDAYKVEIIFAKQEGSGKVRVTVDNKSEELDLYSKDWTNQSIVLDCGKYSPLLYLILISEFLVLLIFLWFIFAYISKKQDLFDSLYKYIKRISSIKKQLVLLLIALLACLDFLPIASGYFILLISIGLAFCVFFLSSIDICLGNKTWWILLCTNFLVILLMIQVKVLLINVIIIAFLIWYKIAPKIAYKKNSLEVSIGIAFVMTFVLSFFRFGVPLLILTFFPIYLLGYMFSHKSILKNKNTRRFLINNLILSTIFFGIFLFISKGKFIIWNMLYTEMKFPGVVTAVYLPLLTALFIWLCCSWLIAIKWISEGILRDNKPENVDISIFSDGVKCIISSILIAVGATIVSELAIKHGYSIIKELLNPNIMFNIIFVIGLYLLLRALVGKGLGTTILVFLTIILACSNYFKILYFDEPFYPWDVFLIRNLIGIIDLYINIYWILFGIIALITTIIIVYLLRKPISKILKPRLSVIIIPFSLIICVCNIIILENENLSQKVNIEKSWYIGKTEIESNGVWVQNYFYLRDFSSYTMKKPEGYSKQQMSDINEKYSKSKVLSQVKKPDIVIIMSESLWNLNKLNGVTFNRNILENVNKYYIGDIVPPVIGGGTANTEFEVLTGLSTFYLNSGVIPYNAYLRTNTMALPHIFAENDYKTTAIHPNVGWFYNRDKVYKYLGFENFIDIDSFDQKDNKGGFISDTALVEKVLDTLEDTDKPNFIFAVSIQNHDPYYDKYKDLEVEARSNSLTNEELNILSNLGQGIYDADQSFGKLINALEKRNKPAIVYFFGDHVSRIESVEGFYDLMKKVNGKDASEDIKSYNTPVAVWSNVSEIPRLETDISSNILSYNILSNAGVEYPNYYNILEEIQNKYPIMNINTKGIVDEGDQVIKDYRSIQYDLLFGTNYLNK